MLIFLEFILKVIEDEIFILLVNRQKELVLEKDSRLPLQYLGKVSDSILSLYFLLPFLDVRGHLLHDTLGIEEVKGKDFSLLEDLLFVLQPIC